MPYITNDLRNQVAPAVAELIASVRELPDTERDGVLNYIITQVVVNSMRPETGWRYYNLHRTKAVFADAHDEFERRLMGPYETYAMRKNGDITAYENETTL
jgi:hypothetical protein